MTDKIKSVQGQLFVDKLAQVIRTADGNHDMGAGELADAIADSGILWELEEAAREAGWKKGFKDGAVWAKAQIRDAIKAEL